jgi:integrase/recombinase XerD
MLTVRDAVARWLTWLEARRSRGTTIKYKQLTREFVELFGDRPVASITADDIEFEFLSRYAGLSKASQRNRYVAIKSFFDLCDRHEWIDRNPLRRIEPPQRDEEFKGMLTADEDRAVQDATMTAQETAIVSLLRYTGLRVSEAARLRWEDLDLEGGRFLEGLPALIVRESKTPNGRRTVPVPAELVRRLRLWRQAQTGEYVIGSKKGTVPIRPNLVHRIVRRVGERVGVKLYPHALRRQYASSALNNDVPLHVVSRALGHASTAVTEKSYARLTNDRVAAEILKGVAI